MKKLILLMSFLYSICANAQDTIKRADLMIKNGKYYKPNSNKLFTGSAATFHENGNIASLTNITNGLKIGKIQVFYDSGNLRVITYEDDKFINFGETQIWNEDGSLAFEGVWVEGKLVKKGQKKPFSGKIITYYNNGKTNETAEFSDGWWNGRQIVWGRSGNVTSDCVFKNNKILDCKKF